MPKKRYNAEDIIHKLREADVLLSQGMNVDQAKRLKEVETENARLKRAVADLTVDKLILKEVAEGKY